jgi:hypothetical protein
VHNYVDVIIAQVFSERKRKIQIKNLDWKTRNIAFIGKIKDDVLDEVIEKVKVILE